MLRGLSVFKKELTEFAVAVPRGGHAAIKRVAVDWFREVVVLTPKLTNFASSKWKYSINSRPSGQDNLQKPKNGTFTPAKTPAFTRLRMDDTLYIYNNVAYIRRLEDGYSAQAPANFFHNSARRADRRLQNEFNKVYYGKSKR